MVPKVIKEATTRANKGVMEDAPYWYDTPLDKLDFEWSPEDKLEIERCCEKIHKNIAQDEMTPYQRFRAMIKGEPKDRQFTHIIGSSVDASRVYDWGGDIIKPVDLLQNPKLLVKAYLNVIARLGTDTVQIYTLSHSEEIWGGRARMIEMGQPVQVEAAIKTIEDLKKQKFPIQEVPGYSLDSFGLSVRLDESLMTMS